MNYFTHGRRFLDNPYFLAGTAVPDWLSVVDRKVRARSKGANALIGDADPRVAAIARGIVQHHHDDDWFHGTPAFAQLSWQFTVDIRDALPPDDGLRPSFLGHILVELLLDDALNIEFPGQLDGYYHALEWVDPQIVQQTVNRIAARPTNQLAQFIDAFRSVRFLFDYGDDDKLLYRLNQVMRRVKLSPLPAAIRGLLAAARRTVWTRRWDLLSAPSDAFNPSPFDNLT